MQFAARLESLGTESAFEVARQAAEWKAAEIYPDDDWRTTLFPHFIDD